MKAAISFGFRPLMGEVHVRCNGVLKLSAMSVLCSRSAVSPKIANYKTRLRHRISFEYYFVPCLAHRFRPSSCLT